MKALFYSIFAISLILLILSVINLSNSLSDKYKIGITKSTGFNSTTAGKVKDQVADEAKRKLIECINEKKAAVENWDKKHTWSAFVVTILTAGSTLVSAIQAAKRQDPANIAANSFNTFAIVVAVLTFLSTLTNFGATYFNDKKTLAVKSMTNATQALNDYYIKLGAAKTAQDSAKVNREYDEKECVD